MRQVLQYLKQTINYKRIIGSDSLSQLFTWVDASYGVNFDLKSHTGDVMSFVYGMAYYKSSKKKINTKISTESKVVGISDYLPYKIWICFPMGDK